MLQKLLPLLLTISLLLSGCRSTDQEPVYYASAQGQGGMLTLSMTFSEAGVITNLEVLEHQETTGIGDEAVKAMPQRILEAQRLDVEAVSGATLTSQAIVSAAEKAVLKAGLSLENYTGTQPETVPQTLEADVVVVGGGAAGFAAAVSAMEQGSTVILLEKMSQVGGNTLHSGGAFNLVDPPRQAAQGIEDSLDLFVSQTYEAGGGKGDPALIRLLGQQSLDAYQWLQNYGAQWNGIFARANGGLWPRSQEPAPTNTAGDIFLTNLQEALLASVDNQVLLNTKAEELLRENGTVVGVLAQNVQTQDTITLRARKGVILATGGYAANTEMLNKFGNTLPLASSNQRGNTGDGILMAMQAGAALVDMDCVQLHPSGNPKTGELQFHLVGESVCTIDVNIKGKRFVNEEASWAEVTSAILEQPNKVMYVVMDSKQTGVQQNFEQDLKSGDLLMGNSLEELAHKMGVDETVLRATVDTYNSSIEKGTPDSFGKQERKPIDKQPFYATLRAPVIHYTLGGIKIDAQARSLDPQGDPIPGLFAAGEVTGGIHGSNRLCGSGLTDAVVFGRIAGSAAAGQ